MRSTVEEVSGSFLLFLRFKKADWRNTSSIVGTLGNRRNISLHVSTVVQVAKTNESKRYSERALSDSKAAQEP
jgi:hypothetical protein